MDELLNYIDNIAMLNIKEIAKEVSVDNSISNDKGYTKYTIDACESLRYLGTFMTLRDIYYGKINKVFDISYDIKSNIRYLYSMTTTRNTDKIDFELSDSECYILSCANRLIPAGSLKKFFAVETTDKLMTSIPNIRFLGELREYIKSDNKPIYYKLNLLSEVLSKSGLNLQKQLDILMDVINNNLRNGILDNWDKYDIRFAYDYEFENISRRKIKKLINNNELHEFLKKSKNSKQVDEIKDVITISEVKTSCIIKAHRLMKKHYFDKIGSIDDNDIDNILKSLEILGINEKIIQKCNKILRPTQKVQTECHIDTNTPTNKSRNSQNKENHANTSVHINKSRSMSKKEYHDICDELNTYFDFKNMKAIRTLNSEEINYCICLLEKIKTDRNKIITFLKIIEKENLKMDAIDRYNNMIKKLEYYDQLPGMKEYIDLLKLYFETKPTNSIEQSDRKKMINDTLNEASKLIPKVFAYEFEGASLLKIDGK